MADTASCSSGEEDEQQHECVVCPQSFDDYTSYYKHLKSHEPKPSDPRLVSDEARLPDGTYRCLVCNKECGKRLYMLRGHMTAHLSGKPFRCPKCYKTVKSALSFVKHMKRQHSKGYCCKKCGKQFSSAGSCKHHMKRRHNRKERCEVCFKVVHKSYLERHYFLHTKEVSFECVLCSEKFILHDYAAKHLRKDHPEVEDPNLFIQECRQTEINDDDEKNEEQHETCHICKAEFVSHWEYVVHVTLGHLTSSLQDGVISRGTKCQGKRGTSRKPRISPSHEISSDKEPLYKCVVCPEAFVKPSDFLEHLHGHAPEPQDPRLLSEARLPNGQRQCLICGTTMDFLSQLRMHLMGHSSKELFPCPLCSKPFKTPYAFLHHLEKHSTGRKLHHCTICDRGFLTKFYLSTHAKVAHSKDKNKTRCEVCFMVISRQDELRHYYKHTGENLCACTICGKQLSSRTIAISHVKRFHPEVEHPVKSIRRYKESPSIEKEFQKKQDKRKKDRKCDICLIECRSRTDYVVHTIMGHGTRPNLEGSASDVCGRSVVNKRRGAHNADAASGSSVVNPYKCVVCPDSFVSTTEIVSHLRGHDEKPEDPRVLLEAELSDGRYQCKICQHISKTKHNFAVHFNSHTKSRKFQCPRCPKALKSSCTFFEHLEQHLQNRGGHGCTICGAVWTFRIGQLDTENPESPYNCASVVFKSAQFLCGTGIVFVVLCCFCTFASINYDN
ncbi:zinc finger protein Xfin-like isoform X2 [Ornithodoros turicata]|uniref:zinc finger protein Xfin-like isoform X2 n=1 Tax=Ornithodoros turicata TaxID=34597 RepID=UPI00313951D3